MIDSDRRTFLKAAVAGATGVSLSLRTFARSTRESGRPVGQPVVTVPLTDHIVQITGAGGNVVVLTGPDSVVMVDSGLQEPAKDLVRAVERLINTHWHWGPRAGGHGRGGTSIIVHEATAALIKQYQSTGTVARQL